MPHANLYEATVSVDDPERSEKILFGHLPRLGDTIVLRSRRYEVQAVVFTVVDDDPVPIASPEIFCRTALRTLGGDALATSPP